MSNITTDCDTLLPTGYVQWRKDVEQLIDTAKLKTAISVNMGTLSLYWNIGKSILQKQKQEGWGKQVIEQLSNDLIFRYPDDRGYSIRNLRYMKRFASAYPDFPILQVPLAELKELPILQATLAELENEGKDFVQVPLAQITWYHHISLLSKVKDEAQTILWYANYGCTYGDNYQPLDANEMCYQRFNDFQNKRYEELLPDMDWF